MEWAFDSGEKRRGTRLRLVKTKRGVRLEVDGEEIDMTSGTVVKKKSRKTEKEEVEKPADEAIKKAQPTLPDPQTALLEILKAVIGDGKANVEFQKKLAELIKTTVEEKVVAEKVDASKAPSKKAVELEAREASGKKDTPAAKSAPKKEDVATTKVKHTCQKGKQKAG